MASLLALLICPLAQGAYDPVGSGTVALRFDRGFLSFLDANRIEVKAAAPARVAKGAVLLPVSSGLMDPTTGKGSIDTEGAFALQNARKRVPFRAVTVKTKRSPLLAKVGGSQFKVGIAKQLTAKRVGFGVEFAARTLRLSTKVATRLNKKLRPSRPFFAGQRVGSITTKVEPETVTVLPEGKVSVELQPGFVAKLDSLFVSVNPIFPAEHTGAPFTLPVIAGGALGPSATTGVVKAGGDLEFLQLHSNAQIFLHEFWFDFASLAGSAEVDIEPSPPHRGKLGRVSVLDLRGGSVSSNPKTRVIGVAGAQLLLNPDTANAFNEAFGEGGSPFAPGEPVASLSFSAQAQ